ncbi:MAG: hypothetical protein ACRDLF_04985 [Solirubrobacteraceae bacterium]
MAARVMVTLTICLLMTQCAIMGVPEVASAEWHAASRPCDVLPGALLPQPVYWFPVGEPAMAPTGYFTDGGPGGTPPASDFTATAVWGDGATSPAAIEQGGVNGCYRVLAPEHRYESVGAFSFDYDVHDAQTGLDHTLAATELHTWSLVPHPLGDPSSQTIHATVGTPWSGVVGEFGLEGNGLYLPYTAQIEWGDGEPPTAGTISHSGNTIAVSGTITYRQPFSGTIGVQVWHGSRLLGTWATSGVDAAEPPPDLVPPAPFRFLGRPMLAYVQRGAHAHDYEIAFRLNSRLPLTSAGRIAATVKTGGRGAEVTHLALTCYEAVARVTSRRALARGARYPFTLVTSEGRLVRGVARPRRFASARRMRLALGRHLDCG